ncbi:MAG: hypothetical protein R2880_00075 [Deinococcales bacterium]
MFKPLRPFFKDPKLSLSEVLELLRQAFMLSFAAQSSIALLTFLAIWVLKLSKLIDFSRASNAVSLSLTLLLIGLSFLPMAFYLAQWRSKKAGRMPALAAALALGTMLAMPTWLALFAYVEGLNLLSLALLTLSGLYYLIGLINLRGYAEKALSD